MTDQKKNQTVTLKKPHPCGSSRFTVVHLGPEVALRCDGCGSMVRMGRERYLKAVVRNQ